MAEFRSIRIPATMLRWPSFPEGPLIWIGIRECFEDDLNDVEILTWPLPLGLARDRWIVRGINRAPFYRKVLEGWTRSEKWPLGFQPQKRLAEPILQNLSRLGDSDLLVAFQHLRQQGLLLPQRKLSRRTWPKDLPWSGGRFCLIDWKSNQD